MTAKQRVSGLFLLMCLSAISAAGQSWKIQTSGIDTNLRGLSVVSNADAKPRKRLAIWASGSNGVILRSLDEGKEWKRLQVAGGETLDFRGIVAFGEKTAYAMSSGEGENSRIYKTTDGGETWNLQYSDKRKEFFLDTIACRSESQCFALGDPIDGKFVLLRTNDGAHWAPLPSDKMPAALPTEGAFAASNTCLLLFNNEIFFGTGGPSARVFRSPDSGLTWTVAETPLSHGNASSGVFSITRVRGEILAVVGGDYQDPKRASATAAYSTDDGKTWQLAEQQPGGYRSALACDKSSLCLAVGPTGEDIGLINTGAAAWKAGGSLSLNATVMADSERGWAVGSKGTVTYFERAGRHQER